MCNREWTSVNSLNLMAANSLNQACETAIIGLWGEARKDLFPKEEFIPHHKPISYTRKLAIFDFYSKENKKFLEHINGKSLDVVRYPSTQPYKDYTNLKNKDQGLGLIKKAEIFILETEKFSKNEDILNKIKSYRTKENKKP